ncbi:hypothetical protein [Jiella sonneratiae]|uniref:Uncharacterized protein n=1 Tax=Jiella sonneratiae TaxID=2816856 RepID=A0ABS3IXF6_9HYPH|nr:hypothetical protein [Jiella sonneratiae]MBO0902099.1 hypothetical protein [Jiella sonneratiae]
MMNTTTLSEAILSAAGEKAIWLRGRQAFRAQGLGAANPYKPDRPEEDRLFGLWEEGFNYERDTEAERQPFF